MAQKMDDIMDLCCTLAETDLKVAVRSYIKGSVTTGGAAALGAVFLGPVGFFVGGAVGGVISWLTSEEFKPLPQILKEMSPAQKQKLYNDVMPVVGHLCWKGATELISLVMPDDTLKQKVVTVVLNFFKEHLKREVMLTHGPA